MTGKFQKAKRRHVRFAFMAIILAGEITRDEQSLVILTMMYTKELQSAEAKRCTG